MVQINFASREVNCKIVYYGPGMSGKTTNLEVVHKKVPANNKGELTSIATEGERTLFFDFLPIDLGSVSGFKTKFQLYTVPGQVYYKSTRKLVLQGVDGIVFVADSQKDKISENIESIQDLKDNIRMLGLNIENIPLVLQYNKRDLPDIMDISELNTKVNPKNLPYFEASAKKGDGVLNTLKAIAKLVLEQLNKGRGEKPVREEKETKPEEDKAEDYICEIEGEKIFAGQLSKYTSFYIKISSQPNRDFQNLSDAEKVKFLDNLINHHILLLEGKKRGVDALESEIALQMGQHIKKIGGEDRFNEYLTKRGLKMEDIRDEITKNIILNKMIKEVIPDYSNYMSIKSGEGEEFFNKNRGLFSDMTDKKVLKEKIASMLKERKREALTDSFYKTIKEGKRIVKR